MIHTINATDPDWIRPGSTWSRQSSHSPWDQLLLEDEKPWSEILFGFQETNQLINLTLFKCSWTTEYLTQRLDVPLFLCAHSSAYCPVLNVELRPHVSSTGRYGVKRRINADFISSYSVCKCYFPAWSPEQFLGSFLQTAWSKNNLFLYLWATF